MVYSIYGQPKFCADKQQYNTGNAKPFPVYVLEIEEVENYYKPSKKYLARRAEICKIVQESCNKRTNFRAKIQNSCKIWTL